MGFQNHVTPMADGLTLNVPGAMVIVPTLSYFGDLLELEENGTLKRIGDPDVSTKEKNEAILMVLHRAIKRHYPDATIDDIKTSFSFEQVQKAFEHAINLRPTPAA